MISILEHYDDVSSPNFDLIHQSLTTLAGDRESIDLNLQDDIPTRLTQ